MQIHQTLFRFVSVKYQGSLLPISMEAFWFWCLDGLNNCLTQYVSCMFSSIFQELGLVITGTMPVFNKTNTGSKVSTKYVLNKTIIPPPQTHKPDCSHFIINNFNDPGIKKLSLSLVLGIFTVIVSFS